MTKKNEILAVITGTAGAIALLIISGRAWNKRHARKEILDVFGHHAQFRTPEEALGLVIKNRKIKRRKWNKVFLPEIRRRVEELYAGGDLERRETDDGKAETGPFMYRRIN